MADNDYYDKRRGPVVTNLGNGEFELNYLTYDYSYQDDFIDQMDVYLIIENNEYKVFSHYGDHEDRGGNFNGGFGVVRAPDDFQIREISRYTANKGYECYRTVRVTVPDRFWGSYRLRVEGTFCYKKNDESPLRFNYEVGSYDLGEPRFSNSPKYMGVVYWYPTELGFTYKDVPMVKKATTTLKYYVDDRLYHTTTYCDDKPSRTEMCNTAFDVNNFDGCKSHVYKLEAEVSYAGRTNKSTVTRTVEAYPVMANLKGEFNPITRSNTISWEMPEIKDFYPSYVSVQRRMYGTNLPWTEVCSLEGGSASQYVDADYDQLQCGKT